MKYRHMGGLVLALAAACVDESVGPSPQVQLSHDLTGPIVVLTRNMYIGANVDRVIAALAGISGEDPVAALQAVLEEFVATDFPARLNAMAAEIAHYRPHVVGLQEVSGVSVNLPPEFGIPSFQAEFQAGLQQALAVRGLSYRVVSNLNFQLAVLGGAITLRDSELLLVASSLPILESAGASFSCGALCTPIPGLGTIKRGWVRAETEIGNRRITFVSTHLESGKQSSDVAMRLGQATELMGTLAGRAGPVVLMGDLNDTPGSSMHELLTGSGFVDLWASLRGSEPGFTCCHASNLQSGSFDHRIDYIMLRGGFLDGTGRVIPGARVEVFGESPASTVQGAFGTIWPSDHGGVVATLPPAR